MRTATYIRILVELLILATVTHSFAPLTQNVVVEVAIVCDKEFGDLFHHNRQKILEYWTVFHWDVNMFYKTLPSSNVSFKITSVTLINSTSDQPFVEKARNRRTWMPNPDRVDTSFSFWIYEKMKELPKFDVALLASGAEMEWYGSYSKVRTPCKIENQMYMGTLVLSDPNLLEYMSTTQPHYFDILLKRGHSHKDKLFKWSPYADNKFFSSFADDEIYKFLRSQDAFCLKVLDEVSVISPVDPDFDDALPQLAPVENCNQSIDNALCDNGLGRCFRGRCLLPSSLLAHVKSGECAVGAGGFQNDNTVHITQCPRSSTPLDRFILERTKTLDGYLLKTVHFPHPDSDVRFKDNDKCLCTSKNDNRVVFEKCTKLQDKSSCIWEKVEDKSEHNFLLKLSGTDTCASPTLSKNIDVKPCDQKDSNLKWTLHEVLPMPDMCRNKKSCEPDLQVNTRLKVRTSDPKAGLQHASLSITLRNRGGPAFAPAVLISWNDTLKLTQVPHKCIRLSAPENVEVTYKCKLGRLLRELESALATTLEFEGVGKILEKSVVVTATSGSQLRYSDNYVDFKTQRSVDPVNMLEFEEDETTSVFEQAEVFNESMMKPWNNSLLILSVVASSILMVTVALGSYCYYSCRKRKLVGGLEAAEQKLPYPYELSHTLVRREDGVYYNPAIRPLPCLPEQAEHDCDPASKNHVYCNVYDVLSRNR